LIIQREVNCPASERPVRDKRVQLVEYESRLSTPFVYLVIPNCLTVNELLQRTSFVCRHINWLPRTVETTRRTHCTGGSSIAEGPRDAFCQLKSCQTATRPEHFSVNVQSNKMRNILGEKYMGNGAI